MCAGVGSEVDAGDRAVTGGHQQALGRHSATC